MDTAVGNVKGTPKIGTLCHVCDDWGITESAELCPTECEAATRYQRIRAANTPRHSHWLRRCNAAWPGDLVDYEVAIWCAQQRGATGSLDTGLRWTAHPTQDPHDGPREFTLTPLSDDQLDAWYSDQGMRPPPGA